MNCTGVPNGYYLYFCGDTIAIACSFNTTMLVSGQPTPYTTLGRYCYISELIDADPNHNRWIEVDHESTTGTP